MHSLVTRRWLLALLPWGLTGCAEMNVYNPFRYHEWELERTYQASLQARVTQLNKVAGQMAGKSPAEQEQVTQQLLTQYRNEVNPFLRSMQVRAAAAATQAASAPQLLALATADTDAQVRREACAALGERRDAESIRLLGQLVATDPSDDVRMAAARALGQAGDAGAIPALASALESSNPAVQRRAISSLRELSGKDYGGDLTAWREFARGSTPQPRSDQELPAFANRWDWRFW